MTFFSLFKSLLISFDLDRTDTVLYSTTTQMRMQALFLSEVVTRFPHGSVIERDEVIQSSARDWDCLLDHDREPTQAKRRAEGRQTALPSFKLLLRLNGSHDRRGFDVDRGGLGARTGFGKRHISAYAKHVDASIKNRTEKAIRSANGFASAMAAMQHRPLGMIRARRAR